MVDNFPKDAALKEELKNRAEKTFQQVWVHPSGNYDQIDMLEWTTKYQSDRIIKLGRPESLSGWHMGWYKQLGYDLRETYEEKLPDITREDVKKYFKNLERYKKDKLNWYK
jgi:rubrerythrin